MSLKRTITKKVILTGCFCAGKTSLISSFVFRKFSTLYQTTIGVRIDKKEVEFEDCTMNLMIWDIGGELDLSHVPANYFIGAQGIVYVVDLTRESFFKNVKNDIDYIKSKLPNEPLLVVGNKIDLIEKDQLETLKSKIPVEIAFFTSAKTGENVETLFKQMSKLML